MTVLGVALVMYVKMRSFLAVDQLVRIYREVSRDIVCASYTAESCRMPKKCLIAWLLAFSNAIFVSPLRKHDVPCIKSDGCALRGSAACHAAQSENAVEVQGLLSDQ